LIQALCQCEEPCDLLGLLTKVNSIFNHNKTPQQKKSVLGALVFMLKHHDLFKDNQPGQFPPPFRQTGLKKFALLIIGAIRLLLRANKGLIKQLLAGLLLKSQSSQNNLKKIHALLKKAGRASQPVLVDLISLCQDEPYKSDQVLQKNLNMLLQQILQRFDTVVEELDESHPANLSKESVESLAQIISLDILDKNLLNAMGDFMCQICQKHPANFQLIASFCERKSSDSLAAIMEKLGKINQRFDRVKNLRSPSKMHVERSPSVMQIEEAKQKQGAEEEKEGEQVTAEESQELRQELKFPDETSLLLKIFKLFNIFFERFRRDPEEEKVPEEKKEDQHREKIVGKVKEVFQSKPVDDFVELTQDILHIVSNANIDINDTLFNLITSVFATFYTDIVETIQLIEANKPKADPSNKH